MFETGKEGQTDWSTHTYQLAYTLCTSPLVLLQTKPTVTCMSVYIPHRENFSVNYMGIHLMNVHAIYQKEKDPDRK